MFVVAISYIFYAIAVSEVEKCLKCENQSPYFLSTSFTTGGCKEQRCSDIVIEPTKYVTSKSPRFHDTTARMMLKRAALKSLADFSRVIVFGTSNSSMEVGSCVHSANLRTSLESLV